MNIKQEIISALAYSILTVQPMYLYPDDIEYIKEYAPELLKTPEVPMIDVPFPGPKAEGLIPFINNNGWQLIDCKIGDENFYKATRLVNEYHKKKYIIQ
jgi:hypothetical protein